MDWNVTKFTEALPWTFFNDVFVSPINLSQKCPSDGALFESLIYVLSMKDLLQFLGFD